MSIVGEAAFRNPAPEYRPVAMWFLNGDLTAAELRRQVRAMAEGGVGGVQLAARTGLTTPYLAARWFELAALVIDEARSCGLDVWLADEYPYPSGASGGEVVLRHPEFRAWHMRATRLTAVPGQEVRAVAPGTVLLKACAVPVAGGASRWEAALELDSHVGYSQQQQVLYQPSRVYLTTRRYMSNDPRPTLQWQAPPRVAGVEGLDGWEIWLIAAAEVQRYKFFGAYVDLCNPEACRFFLETTYKRYLDALGAERFARLAGFFVDEAHPQNWSWCLPDAFRRRCGYDLYQALPALWTDTGPQTAQVRYDYHQCITELFVDSFHRPLAEWCREHGVRLSLEVGSTRNLVQRHADIPGIDPGHHKVGVPLDEILDRELPSFRGNLNFPASLAAQTGRTRVLDELFHSVGWSMTLQDMKGMIDRAAARGANLFACHGFCYTIGGLKKWDAPPSEFDQNPYWPHFPLLADYAGRLAYALSRGRRVAPVALIDPITSLWVHGEGTGSSATSRDEVARRLAGDWVYLMRELVAAQRPHDNLDPLLLAEAEVEDGALRLGDATYRVVVLPPVTTLERAAWDKLEAFARGGGTVIACGLLPYETIEPHQDVVARCGAAFGADPLSLRQAYEEEGPAGLEVARRGPFALLRTTGTLARAGAAPALLDLLEELVPLQLRLTPDAGAPARRHFLLAQRGHDDQQLFFVANSSMEEHQCEVALRVQEGRPATVTRLDLESGTTEALPVSWEPGAAEQRLRLRFPRHGAHLLLVTPAGSTGAGGSGATSHNAPAEHPQPSPVPLPASVALDLRGEWRCTPEGANVLRLDRFRFTTTHDQPGVGASEPPHLVALAHAPLVEPKPLINVLQDLEQAQQPWPTPVQVVPVFGAPPVLQLKLPATAWYEARFMVHHAPGRVTLCLEDDALLGAWDIWINRHHLPRESFVQRRRWDTGNREVEVASLLQPGRNEVLVRVQVTEPWQGLVDALYLLGDFAVSLDPSGQPALAERAERLRWDDLIRGGNGDHPYPYYAGTLHLRRTQSIPATPAGEVVIRLPDEELMFSGVVQLTINDVPLGARAWAPYEWTVPGAVLRPGENEVAIAITNTLVGQLEGKRYDPQRRTPTPLR